jgi:hypothetical protein
MSSHTYCLVVAFDNVDFFQCFHAQQLLASLAGDHRLPAGDCLGTTLSQSQSHVTTDDQSVSKSWIRAPCGSRDRILISV